MNSEDTGAMNLYTDSESLDEILTGLQVARTPQEREERSRELKQHIEVAARELSIERFSAFEGSLFENIYSLVNSQRLDHRKAGNP